MFHQYGGTERIGNSNNHHSKCYCGRYEKYVKLKKYDHVMAKIAFNMQPITAQELNISKGGSLSSVTC